MCGNFDESLLSTASTLNDNCSTSFNETLDTMDRGMHVNGSLPFSSRTTGVGEISGDKKGNTKVTSSPTTTAVNIQIMESTTLKTEKNTESKLERLRARTRLLRKESARRVEESRASLRKSRTVSIGSTYTLHPPQPFPPPSVYNQATAARTKREDSGYTNNFKRSSEAEFSDFIRRSNSVIDRLTTEMAMAGNIIDESNHILDTTVDKIVNKTNDLASNLDKQSSFGSLGQEKGIILNEDISTHNVSVGVDWDQTTLSATQTGSRFTSPSISQENSERWPQQRTSFSSGLPPPEVVVKRMTPRSFLRITSPLETLSTASPVLLTTDDVDMYQRQLSPSKSSSRVDCVSMYNNNQKCEKLKIENDCLKRQLELLESRHRDSQRILMENLFQGRGEHKEWEKKHLSTSLINKFSRSISFSHHRSKKKLNGCRHLSLLLLFVPIVISLAVRSYDSIRSINLPARKDIASRNSQAFRKRKRFSPTVFIENYDSTTEEKMQTISEERRNKQDTRTVHSVNDDLTRTGGIDDVNENHLILRYPSPRFRNFGRSKVNEKSSSKAGSLLKRFLSRIEIPHEQNLIGVWSKKYEQIATKIHHAEL